MDIRPIHSSDELIQRAAAIAAQGRKRTVAVAAAQDVDVIEAVCQAFAEGFLEGILIGDESQIRSMAAEQRCSLDMMQVVHEPDPGQAAHLAAQLAGEKKADAIMKGFLPTSALLKVVLDRRHGLRMANTLSHCAVLDIPGYHKLLTFTDGGMVVRPTVEQKMQILENAVLVAKAMGLSPVKIALSAATNMPSEKMPHTLSDVGQIIPLARERLSDIIIDGPMTLDVALSRTAADKWGRKGDVCGDADIWLVDTIEEGNIVSKSLIQLEETVFAGVIVGARVPVSLVSRTDTVKNKKASLALACLIADYYEQSHIWGG